MWWKNHGAPNQKWWKHGGKHVVEVEKKKFLKKKSWGKNSRIGYIFLSTLCFPPRFSTTIFHHVKIGVAALLLLLFSFFSFLERKEEKIFVKGRPPRGYMVETNGGNLYICHALQTLGCPGGL